MCVYCNLLCVVHYIIVINKYVMCNRIYCVHIYAFTRILNHVISVIYLLNYRIYIYIYIYIYTIYTIYTIYIYKYEYNIVYYSIYNIVYYSIYISKPMSLYSYFSKLTQCLIVSVTHYAGIISKNSH